MLHDIVEVRAVGGHRLFIRFDDDVAGEVDLASRLRFDGVFAPLRDPITFAQARVHPELGTVVWPNGADLDPLVLYSLVVGRPIPIAQPSVAGH